ncbi:hypothetical protein CICLE_v10017334mg [Citrus x clementina]|uniref:Uncharacterized protein n=1 Tax=Citrus clementina TaxID=85681 RepID=V4W7U7_CITCL|nr:hypothetical protein CICLE_v10017334mg [Citrus x clementina]
MGLVDVTLVLRYSWFCTYGKCAFFSTEAECLKLVEWAKGCVMLESVAESLAKQKKNYDLILMKECPRMSCTRKNCTSEENHTIKMI